MSCNSCRMLISLSLLASIGCYEGEPVEEIRLTPASVVSEAAEVVAAEGDWPWWRGPARDGTSNDTNLPTTWTDTENVRWKTEIPGRGHSSPTVWGDRIFVTTADEAAETQMLLAYDRQTGEELWQKVIHNGNFMHTHTKNSHASATPACDGERVITTFINGDALHATAVDLDGNTLWQQVLGPFKSEHGFGQSPALYKSLVIVNGDNAGSSYLAALDRTSGEIVWRVPRERPGRHGNYASPMICELSGGPQLVLPGFAKVASYDPATGELLWSCDGPSLAAANTVAHNGELVFASGGFPEKELLAIRADGRGDVSNSHVVWRKSKAVAYVPSLLYHGGLLLMISDGGVATCYDGATGEQHWQQRLGGNFSASPVLGGGNIYVTDEQGTTHVFAAAKAFQAIAENHLEGGGFASPVICGGEIYLRIGSTLYCLAI